MLIIHCKFPSFVFFFCQFPPRQFCMSVMKQDYRDHNANIENFHRANIDNPEFQRFFLFLCTTGSPPFKETF